ncbi:enhancer of mRNA-decapping protein 4-like [Gordionus sp. m RMFG-2023]|uniref:enhancer of mRNA-decapping protein 4-like n=1 Tax=Gordionus sp. m RMFG-2023 TaxID=3053472 RepID=UPI0031FE19F1
MLKKTETIAPNEAANKYTIHGDNILIQCDLIPFKQSSGNDKVIVENLANYQWETKWLNGDLVDCQRKLKFVAYPLKSNDNSCGIRIMQNQTKIKPLLKSSCDFICDVSFSQHVYVTSDSQICKLAYIDAKSNTFVYDICMIKNTLSDSSDEYSYNCIPLYHMIPSGQTFHEGDLSHQENRLPLRVIWKDLSAQSQIRQILLIILAKELLIIDFTMTEDLEKGDAKIFQFITYADIALPGSTNDLIKIIHKLTAYGADNTANHNDIPYMIGADINSDGSSLAVFYQDGHVKFYKSSLDGKEPLQQLFEFKPHNLPVTGLLYLDHAAETNPLTSEYDKNLAFNMLTLASHNSEIKLWKIAPESAHAECLQKFSFVRNNVYQPEPSAPACVTPATFYAKYRWIDYPLGPNLFKPFLVITDINGQTLYLLEMGKANGFDSLTRVVINQPVISFSILNLFSETIDLFGMEAFEGMLLNNDNLIHNLDSHGSVSTACLEIIALHPKCLRKLVIHLETSLIPSDSNESVTNVLNTPDTKEGETSNSVNNFFAIDDLMLKGSSSSSISDQTNDISNQDTKKVREDSDDIEDLLSFLLQKNELNGTGEADVKSIAKNDDPIQKKKIHDDSTMPNEPMPLKLSNREDMIKNPSNTNGTPINNTNDDSITSKAFMPLSLDSLFAKKDELFKSTKNSKSIANGPQNLEQEHLKPQATSKPKKSTLTPVNLSISTVCPNSDPNLANNPNSLTTTPHNLSIKNSKVLNSTSSILSNPPSIFGSPPSITTQIKTTSAKKMPATINSIAPIPSSPGLVNSTNLNNHKVTTLLENENKRLIEALKEISVSQAKLAQKMDTLAEAVTAMSKRQTEMDKKLTETKRHSSNSGSGDGPDNLSKQLENILNKPQLWNGLNHRLEKTLQYVFNSYVIPEIFKSFNHLEQKFTETIAESNKSQKDTLSQTLNSICTYMKDQKSTSGPDSAKSTEQSIQRGLQTALKQNGVLERSIIGDCFKVSFSNDILPKIEALLAEIFKQLEISFERGMKDFCVSLDRARTDSASRFDKSLERISALCAQMEKLIPPPGTHILNNPLSSTLIMKEKMVASVPSLSPDPQQQTIMAYFSQTLKMALCQLLSKFQDIIKKEINASTNLIQTDIKTNLKETLNHDLMAMFKTALNESIVCNATPPILKDPEGLMGKPYTVTIEDLIKLVDAGKTEDAFKEAMFYHLYPTISRDVEPGSNPLAAGNHKNGDTLLLALCKKLDPVDLFESQNLTRLTVLGVVEKLGEEMSSSKNEDLTRDIDIRCQYLEEGLMALNEKEKSDNTVGDSQMNMSLSKLSQNLTKCLQFQLTPNHKKKLKKINMIVDKLLL